MAKTIESAAVKQQKYIRHMFDKLRNIRGVQHVLVFNAAGILLRTTFNHSEAVPAIGLFSDLIFRARRAIEVFDRCDGLTSMRIKTLKFEILISKDTDDLIFIVFQDAKDEFARLT